MTILCPKCLGIAQPVPWAKQAELPLQECPECNAIWMAEHYQRLWDKYQINGKRPSRNHLSKVYEG